MIDSIVRIYTKFLGKKLYSCPFCGGDDLNTSHKNEIWCKSCDAGVHLGDHGDKTQEFTIDSWNRRSPELLKLAVAVSKLPLDYTEGCRVDSYSCDFCNGQETQSDPFEHDPECPVLIADEIVKTYDTSSITGWINDYKKTVL